VLPLFAQCSRDEQKYPAFSFCPSLGDNDGDLYRLAQKRLREVQPYGSQHPWRDPGSAKIAAYRDAAPELPRGAL
jgi:hypothetical protein